MVKRTRDSQRSKVYAWERQQSWWAQQEAVLKTRWGSTTYSQRIQSQGDPSLMLSLDECKALVAKLWSAFPCTQPVPVVKDGRGCRYARGCWRYVIFPVWSRTIPIVCHEVAHALTQANNSCYTDFYGKRHVDPGHGPMWLGIYAQLLELAGVANASTVRESALRARLHVIPSPLKRLSA